MLTAAFCELRHGGSVGVGGLVGSDFIRAFAFAIDGSDSPLFSTIYQSNSATFKCF
jgi:hypothetical protein